MALESSLVDRAAPPGSIRYFAQLYAPAKQRELLLALLVIDTEIRESSGSGNHDVAHTRLKWWRDEVDRLVNRSPQHPATRLLAEQIDDCRPFARLHELIVAGDMDLARMTFANTKELRAYTERSGGVFAQLAGWLLAGEVAPLTNASLARLGSGMREIEIIRDLRRDVHAGRLYLPTDQMDTDHVTLHDLEATVTTANIKKLLAAAAHAARTQLNSVIETFSAEERANFLPLMVMSDLYLRLLTRIERLQFEVLAQRIELGPFERLWHAWRAARRNA